jgi:predicted HicB family RNase H-like nuclease
MVSFQVEGDMSVLNRLEKRLRGREEPRLTERLTIRLDERTYKALEELAQGHNIAVSELAREVLTMLAEEHLARKQ